MRCPSPAKAWPCPRQEWLRLRGLSGGETATINLDLTLALFMIPRCCQLRALATKCDEGQNDPSAGSRLQVGTPRPESGWSISYNAERADNSQWFLISTTPSSVETSARSHSPSW